MFPDLSTNRDLSDPRNYTTFGYSGGYATETDKQRTGKLARSYTPANLLNLQAIPGGGTYGTATAAQKLAYGQSVLVPNDLRSVQSGGNIPSSWLTFDRNFVYGTLDAYNKNVASPANLGGTFDAVETINTAFVQSDLTTELAGRELRLNAGVRYVRTGTDIDNYLLVSGGYRPLQCEGSYNNVLPSLTASYEITDQLTWRSSWGKTIKRSSISLIARAFNVPNAGNPQLDAGNPDLQP